MEYYKNNDACVSGIVASKYVFSHEIYGEKFYLFDLAVSRLSDAVDIIPVMISERITDVTADNLGAYVRINGQFRSFNKREGEKSRLILCFFAQKIEQLGVDHGKQEVERLVRVRHDKEQRCFRM